jgi:alpha-glucosidase
VIEAEIGKLLITARRKGKTWYVGGMSAGNSRDIELALPFLGPGRFSVKTWKDAPDAETDPNRLVMENSAVSSQDIVKLHIAKDGGFVMQLMPQ